MHQVREVRRVKAKTLAGHRADKRGARLVAGVVELAPTGIAAKVLRVFRREKRALVVVEPPGEARIARIFEIHNGVLIAVEQRRIEGLGRPVRHPRVAKLRVRVHRTRDKTAEEGSRSRPIETMVVVQHAFEHEKPEENLSACLNARQNATGGCAGCQASIEMSPVAPR